MSGSNERASTELLDGSVTHQPVLLFWILRPGFWTCVAVCTFLTAPASAAEANPILGWQGAYVVGSWTKVTIPIEAEPGDYHIRVTAPDPDGHRVTFSSTERLAPGQKSLRGYFKAGQYDPKVDFDPGIDVEVASAATGKTVWTWKSTSGGSAPLNPAVKLIVTLGKLSAFDWEDATTFRTVPITADELPDDTRAYESVSMLVISGRPALSQAQSAALRDWVARGGRLVISLPLDVSAARDVVQPLNDWIPVTVGAEPVTVSEFGKLEYFAGKNVRIFAGRLSIPSIKITQGEVLAGSRDEALLVRAPYGLGSVSVLAMDVTQPPLSKWTELSSLGRRLAENLPEAVIGTGASTRNLQLSSTGITDLATQLHAAQEDFGDRRASPWLAMGLLMVLLLIIGPVDYLVVHRLLKWPRGTWLTFPAWVILAAVLCTNLAAARNGSSMQLNQLNLVNYDVTTSTCHQRLWTNVYSPATQRRSVSVKSAIAAEDSPTMQQSGWSGVPESSFGGMLRPAGVHMGRADYQLTDNGVIDRLPLTQWSSKSLVTEVHSSAAGLVDAQLQSNGVGQVSGTITHHFSGPIEDWFLAFGNRVYRYKKARDDALSLPLPQNQVLRIDQPKVFPRELRGFLTGKVVTHAQNSGSQAADLTNQFINYDSLSRDPDDILRILTFHNEVGAGKYTGLTNRLLETEDLSHLLKLGRAVLFGRLNAPVATVQLDGADTAPSRESTFIRIVLPVKKVGSDINRSLEHLHQ